MVRGGVGSAKNSRIFVNILTMQGPLMKPRRAPAIRPDPRTEDWRGGFEERLLADDLAALLAEIEQDPVAPAELAQGLRSLQYFREFYHGGQADDLPEATRARLAAYDAAWRQELIDLALSERADYRGQKTDNR